MATKQNMRCPCGKERMNPLTICEYCYDYIKENEWKDVNKPAWLYS